MNALRMRRCLLLSGGLLFPMACDSGSVHVVFVMKGGTVVKNVAPTP